MNAIIMNTARAIMGVSLLGLVSACNAPAPPAPADTMEAPTITVAQGRLRGADEHGVQRFLGIPYAAAPVLDRRWRPPAAPEPWEGVRDATTFAANCPQHLQPAGRPPWTHEYLVHGQTSEDCLFLNLWVPETPANTPRAVLVWFHGGAFVEGSGSVPVYDGAELARQGIIVASVNYRLDALGFLAHPELSRENGGTSGNYALYDMIAALRWIQDNIHAFGGDPTRVTIAGQSAGASAVHLLIAAPSAKGLFARAIAQSGSGMGLPSLTLAQAERLGTAFAEQAGAPSMAALRALPPETLLATAASIPGMEMLRFMPIVDGTLIPHAADELPPGHYHDTPLMTGLTADESSGMLPGYGVETPETLATRLRALFGKHAGALARLYPANTDAEAVQAQKALLRDRGIAATWLWAQTRLRNGGQQPLWLYLFTHPEPGPDAARYGAFHSAELPYLFGTLDASPERPFTEADRELSRVISRYWVNFVNHGDPNGGGLPAWPVFAPDNPQLMHLQPVPATHPVLDDAKREAFIQHVEAGGRVGLF